MDMRTRSQSVTDELRKMIVQGEIPPDEHVQEQLVADLLGVSRTPVRAAMTALASEGYLIYRPKRGYVVREFHAADVLDAWQMRAWLEGLAALRAAERGLAAEAEGTLREAIRTGDMILSKGYLDPDDLPDYRDMNTVIHNTIIEAAGSRLLEQAIHQTRNIPMVSERIIPWNDYDNIKRSHDDHHRVLEAILAGEAWRAEAVMREHIYSGSKRLSGSSGEGCSSRPAAGLSGDRGKGR